MKKKNNAYQSKWLIEKRRQKPVTEIERRSRKEREWEKGANTIQKKNADVRFARLQNFSKVKDNLKFKQFI